MALPGVHAMELAGLKAWPALHTERDGSWVLRAAGGYTKRANSAQCLNPADDDNVLQRLARVRDWFDGRALPSVFRVTPLCGTRLLEALGQGWTAFDHSHTFGMSLSGRAFAADPSAELRPATDEAWLEAQRVLQGYDAVQLAGLRALIGGIEVPARGVTLRGTAGEPLASLVVSVADGIAYVANVITSPAHRRQRLGTRLVATALRWAMGEGAHTAALNVQADNAAAQALYRSIGYAHLYDYHYCRPRP